MQPEVERRLVVRHDELIAGFEKELARLYGAMYPYARGECMEVIFKGMSPEQEDEGVALGGAEATAKTPVKGE